MCQSLLAGSIVHASELDETEKIKYWITIYDRHGPKSLTRFFLILRGKLDLIRRAQ